MAQSRLIGMAGLVAWLLCGLRSLTWHGGPAMLVDGRWGAVYGLFGALLAADFLVAPRAAGESATGRAGWRGRRSGVRLLLVAAEAAAALGLVLLGCNGYEGILLAAVAAQLAGRLQPPAAMAWIGAQTLLLFGAISLQMSGRAAWLLTPPYLGFQLVAFFTFHVMAREVAARAALAAANAELRALQEILADSSRLAERLRLAGELHDALGHRLTALTLNLEAALQRSSGALRVHVETAQALARELLADVRQIVAASHTARGGGVQMSEALAELVSVLPRPQVHLEVPADLRIADPERAHILLRCAQEIVTNAARHSDAENLWIVVRSDGNACRIAAHDDGRGDDLRGGARRDGIGLRGMRARVEAAGGELRIMSQPGRGFDITALLPLRGGAA